MDASALPSTGSLQLIQPQYQVPINMRASITTTALLATATTASLYGESNLNHTCQISGSLKLCIPTRTNGVCSRRQRRPLLLQPRQCISCRLLLRRNIWRIVPQHPILEHIHWLGGRGPIAASRLVDTARPVARLLQRLLHPILRFEQAVRPGSVTKHHQQPSEW